eukprot:RCo006057
MASEAGTAGSKPEPAKKKRPFAKRTSTTFQLVHKPYDDPKSVNEAGATTLVLRKEKGQDVAPADGVDWDSYDLRPTLNMHVTDDTVDEGGADAIFKGAVFEDFDQDFIRQMCQKPDDEATTVLDFKNFPCHDPALAKSDLDQMFAVQMERFDADYRLPSDDERVKGPLGIEDYVGTLEMYMKQIKRINFLHKWRGPNVDVGELPKGKRVYLNPNVLKHIYHENEQGYFVTCLLSKKDMNPMVEYFCQRKAAVNLTKERMHNPTGEALTEDLPEVTPEEEDAVVAELCPDKNLPQWDCETIVSTYSNLYNRPEVIPELPGGAGGKIRVSAKSGRPVVQAAGVTAAEGSGPQSSAEAVEALQAAQAGEKSGEGDAEEAQDEDDKWEQDLMERLSAMTSTVCTSGRPRDETPEQRRERKALCHAGR